MNFEAFKRTLNKSISDTASQNVYRIHAKTVTEVYEKAKTHFNIPLEFIRFEVEHTNDEEKNAIINAGEHTVLAYPASEYFIASETSGAKLDDLKNGEAFVRRGNGRVYLIVEPPMQNGKPVLMNDVMHKIQQKVGSLDGIKKSQIRFVTAKASGVWVEIGAFIHNEAHDCQYEAYISEDKMKAMLMMKPAFDNGAEPSAGKIKKELEDIGVKYGILENKLLQLEKMPVYNQWVEVATGKPVVHEEDAKIILVSTVKKKTIQSDRVSPIITTKKGEIVAIKQSIAPGEEGCTVTNQIIFPNTGEDITLNENKYVSISEDGTKAIAKIAGSVRLHGKSIMIDELLIIPSDVSSKTGNINFSGSVIIYGNIPDDYEVNVEGNLEVHGGIANSKVKVGKNLVVHRGINGKESAVIQVQESLLSRFLESVTVRVQGDCIIEDSIIQSNVICEGRVIVVTGRGRVASSDINSSQLIQVRNVGSELGSPTTLKVISLFDEHEKMEQARELIIERQKQLRDLRTFLGDVGTIKKILKSDKSGHSKTVLKKIKEAKKLRLELSKLKKIAYDFRVHFQSIKTNGKIIIEEKINSGTTITIDDKNCEMKNTSRNVVFYLKDDVISQRRFSTRQDGLNVPKIKRDVFV